MRLDPFKHNHFRTSSNPEIFKQLQELGLKPTGSVEGDLKAIQETLKNNPKKELTANLPKKPDTPPEIVAFMRKIGISPTNTREGDFSAIMDKLRSLLSSSKTKEEKQEANEMINEFNILIASDESSQEFGKIGLQEFRGRRQLGNMNKVFIKNFNF